MELYYICTNCSFTNVTGFNDSDRAQLENRFPNGTKLVCKRCKTRNKVVPNDIRAQESKSYKYLVFVSIVISIVLGWLYLSKYLRGVLDYDLYVLAAFAVVISIPPFIASLIARNERKSIRLFNSHYV